MPKVKSEKRTQVNTSPLEGDKASNGDGKSKGWSGGQLFGSEVNENTFQGGGFKDKEKAKETLRLLDGRDISYQFQIVNSMYHRAKVIVKRTKDEEKVKNLNEAIETFEAWINDYKAHSRSRENFNYLPLDTVEAYPELGKKYGIVFPEGKTFFEVYAEVEGDLKRLRQKKVNPDDESSITWDIHRNNNLRTIQNKVKTEHLPLYETDMEFRGLPSKEHVEMILWGYSPEPTKVKKCITLIAEKLGKKVEANDENMDEQNSDKSAENAFCLKEVSDAVEDVKVNLLQPKNTNRKSSGWSENFNGDSLSCHGFGFKDKEKAQETLRLLEGRDVSYQHQVVSVMFHRTKMILGKTKDTEKIKNLHAAADVFDKWLNEYKILGRSKENYTYLPLEIVEAYEKLAVKYGIRNKTCLNSYREVAGDLRGFRLKKVNPNDEKSLTWDIHRNNYIRSWLKKLKKNTVPLYETESEFEGLPSKQHVEMILWAYSPDSQKVKKLIPLLEEKLNVAH